MKKKLHRRKEKNLTRQKNKIKHICVWLNPITLGLAVKPNPTPIGSELGLVVTLTLAFKPDPIALDTKNKRQCLPITFYD